MIKITQQARNIATNAHQTADHSENLVERIRKGIHDEWATVRAAQAALAAGETA